MTISLKHKFTSPKSDGADATLVKPSNWNDEHDLTMATNRLLGRTTAGAGVAEEISVGTGLTLSAGSLSVSTNTYQPLDATLTALAGVVTGVDVLPYFSGTDTVSTTTLTTAGRALLDDASASAQRTTLGVGTGDSPEFLAVNVGNASDTTISRASAGVIAVEGNHVPSPAAQAQGDVLYHNGTTWARLAAGTSGHFLKTNGAAANPSWAAAGGATGAGGDQVFYENSLTVTTSYSISSGKSAMSTGPITINSGVTVTVPSGSRWVVL